MKFRTGNIFGIFVLHARLISPLIYVLFACSLILPLRVFAEPCLSNDKDIVRVTGRVVVFYGMTQKQFDMLSLEDQEAYTELLSDFYEYSNRLGHYLDKHHIRHILTGSRYIEIKYGEDTYCFDKKTRNEEVGLILSDTGKKAEIIPGMFIDTEIIPTVVKYYALSNDR